MTAYKAIDVWERRDTRTTVRYRCFQSLETGKYCVQSADFYRSVDQPTDFDRHFLELFAEQDPIDRSGEYDTLEAAIAAHKRDFAAD